MPKQLVAFPYYGGKYYQAKWIISLLPNHLHYVEPFCGAAHVALSKPQSTIETINDLNKRVVNFFRVLREQPDQLIRLLTLTPFSRFELEQSNESCDDPLEQARRFYVNAYMAFGSQPDRPQGNSSWSYAITTPQTKVTNRYNNAVTKLGNVVNRLKNIQIECRPALDIIKRFDRPETLFYCDPPYHQKTRVSVGAYNNFEMTDQDHKDLSMVLHACQGKVAISGYQSELYDSLYDDWTCHKKDIVSRTSPSTKKSARVECLWVNY